MGNGRYIHTVEEKFMNGAISRADIDTLIKRNGSTAQSFEAIPHLGIFYLPHEHCLSHDREACVMIGKVFACKYKVTRFSNHSSTFEAMYWNMHDTNFYKRVFRSAEWILDGNILVPAHIKVSI